MKSPDTVSRFFDNEAAVNLAIAHRMRATVNGEPSLRYFDGATMATYQQPSRIVEDIWCVTKGANCDGKHGFDPFISDIPLGPNNVHMDEASGPLLVSKQSIPGETYLNLQESTHSLLVPPFTYELLTNSTDSRAKIALERYDIESTDLVRTRVWCTMVAFKVFF